MNFEGASNGNRELENFLRQYHERMLKLERAVQVQGVDSDKQTKVAVAPPRASIDVQSIAGGRMTVAIRNPEFSTTKGQNPLRTPIYHKIEYSPDPLFRSAVTELPPSIQTHWPIDIPTGTRLHVRVSSSYDGRTWNQPSVHQGEVSL